MTMPEPTRPRKPPSRFWLFAPYVVVLIAAVAWSLYWLSLRGMVITRLDDAAQRLRAEGYVVDWKARRVSGYPFRLAVSLDAPRLVEPSGWGLSAPSLKAQAMAYVLDDWVLVAGDGVTLHRPAGGDVAVTGQALRASLAGFSRSPPRIAIEGVGLTFTPAPGGAPFSLVSAKGLGLYLRPSGEDGAEGYLRLEGASAPAPRLFGRLGNDQPFDLTADVEFTRKSAFQGQSWPAAARAWAAGGGTMSVVSGDFAAGPVKIKAVHGQARPDDKGRLAGDLALDFGQGPLDLVFSNGSARLGRTVVGPAPRLY
jgi:hypothetical protein